jgi:hypothetical protein
MARNRGAETPAGRQLRAADLKSSSRDVEGDKGDFDDSADVDRAEESESTNGHAAPPITDASSSPEGGGVVAREESSSSPPSGSGAANGGGETNASIDELADSTLDDSGSSGPGANGTGSEQSARQQDAAPEMNSIPDAPPTLTWASFAAVIVMFAVSLYFASVVVYLRQIEAEVFGGTTLGRYQTLTFSFGIMTAFLAVIHAVDRAKKRGGAGSKGYGIFRPVIGTDHRWSTSLTQTALWTLTVGFALAFLLGRSRYEAGIALNNVLVGDRWDEYLLLLGGPFAAAVLAKGIVTHKVTNGTLQKGELDEEQTPRVREIVTKDAGGADLVDAQYLLFNVVALAYFWVVFVSDLALPEIPSTLLALTGGSAALYSANKAIQANPPVITSVVPRSITAGKTITVYGSNFDPGADTSVKRRITATITGHTGELSAEPGSTTSEATFELPEAVASGEQQLRVTSSAGVQTDPQAVVVMSPSPLLLGLDSPAALRPGAKALLAARNLGAGPVAVAVGDVNVPGSITNQGTRVTFSVPHTLGDSSSVTVKVTTARGDVASTTLPVERPRILGVVHGSANELVVRVDGVGGHPRFTVNDRDTVANATDEGYLVTLSGAVLGATDLRVRVVDGARRSEEVTIPNA